MVCPGCGHQSPPTSRYCAGCGVPLSGGVGPGAATATLPATQHIRSATAELVVRLAGTQELPVPLTKPGMLLGRAATCDISLDVEGVSQVHAAVIAQNGTYMIRDQGSTNGIYQAGHRVSEALLSETDPVYLADPAGTRVALTLRPLSPAAGTVPTVTPIADGGRTIDLARRTAPLTLGRAPDNDVAIDLPLVSRHHARLERQGGGWHLSDLKSTNGTYVNGQQVHGSPRMLQPSDEIRLGPAAFRFQGSALLQYVLRPQIRIDAANLVRRTRPRGGNVILHDVSLTILPQEFVALVGGSGAGKSTLLGALNGVAPAQEGAVLLNGQDFYRAPGPYRGLLGYVPQDDILHRDLPVDRALDYAAQLRLPPDTSPAERARRISAVLADVKMEPQRHQMITRLSGGQRKRVSIAVELLANPSVLFLDEPTSGLDPGLDKTVMTLLQGLCAKGQTVILVTHATENIRLCTHVAFLARGGRLVYFGPPVEAPAYFGVASFPDIYSLLDARDDEGETQERRFLASPYFKAQVLDRRLRDTALPAAPAPPAPVRARQTRAAAWRQGRILTRRYAELLWRDRVNLTLLLAQAPVVAVLLTLVTARESFTRLQSFRSEQVLLMLTLAAIWFGTINAAREIVKERPIYLRERAVSLRIWPYVLSKFSVLAVLAMVQALALLWIVSLKASHLPGQGIIGPASWEMYVTLVLTSLAGVAGGLLISSLVSSSDRAMSIVPVILIALVIFSGGVFELQGLPGVVSLFSLSRWCLAALGSTVDLNGLAVSSYLSPGWPKEMYSSPDAVHLLGYWLVLAAFSAVFLVGTTTALRRKDANLA